MTIDDVFQILRDRGAALVVQGDSLRYLGPTPLATDDPLRAGIAVHRAMLIELLTYAPDGRCVAEDCYRLKVAGAGHCPDHLGATSRSETGVEPCRNENGICRDSKHEHVDVSGDEGRSEQADRHLGAA